MLRSSCPGKGRDFQPESDDLHNPTACGTRKGIPLQPLPLSAAKDRNSTGSGLNRKAGENMVSKPENEMEEGE